MSSPSSLESIKFRICNYNSAVQGGSTLKSSNQNQLIIFAFEKCNSMLLYFSLLLLNIAPLKVAVTQGFATMPFKVFPP